jgi:hypothetical protein
LNGADLRVWQRRQSSGIPGKSLSFIALLTYSLAQLSAGDAGWWKVEHHTALLAATDEARPLVVGQFGAHWFLRLRGDDAEAGDDLRFDGYDGVSVVDPRIE